MRSLEFGTPGDLHGIQCGVATLYIARLAEIGIEEELFAILFKASKDIRDKYVLSRLVWDLGIEDLMQMAGNNSLIIV